jgi:hypothetical protein
MSMRPKASVPPSRQGKKQMITYVDVDLVEAVEAKAAREEKTLQELLAEAANAVMLAHGRQALFKPEHQRVLRRSSGRSQARTRDNAPMCRTDKRPIAGWYDYRAVELTAKFSKEIGMGRERMLETGLRHITGLSLMKGVDLEDLAAE